MKSVTGKIPEWILPRYFFRFQQTLEKGFPELPSVTVSLQLLQRSVVSTKLESSECDDVQLDFPLVPSRGTIYRDQDPSEIPYVYSPYSMGDFFFPETPIDSGEPYVFRDVRGLNINIFPFRYNTEKGVLRVCRSISVKISENPGRGRNSISLKRRSARIPAVMEQVYGSLFINRPAAGTKRSLGDHNIAENGEMLVIYTERDAEAIKPYLDWKREKGFTVHTAVVEKGTSINELVREEYARNPAILYIQIVGDWDDVQSTLGTQFFKPTDPMVGCVVGEDYYPDLIVGRFSANSPEELAVQVQKSIRYEAEPDLEGEWYGRALGLSSAEGGNEGDDYESDHSHLQVIRHNKLKPFTYDTVYDLTDVSPYSNPGNVKSSDVAAVVDSGIGLLNYVGHGDEDMFVTSEYSNYHVLNSINGDKLPIIFSVACVNGMFNRHGGDCFAEAWLKKENGGAVATVMSTINQPWTSPMRGQDYMNDILTGGYDYSENPGSGTSTFEGRTTFGSIVFNALVLMYAEGESDRYFEKESLETLKTWTVFGDASLQVRTEKPHGVEVYETIPNPGELKVVVKTEGNAEGVTVALSRGSKMFSGNTDKNGEVVLSHDLHDVEARLTVTGLNLETIRKDIYPDNQSPVADAGKDLEAVEFSEVTLDASLSKDENISTLTYNWEQLEGPEVELTGSDSVSPRFSAPEVDESTDLIFQLTVTDERGYSSQDQCTVTVVNRIDPEELEDDDEDSDSTLEISDEDDSDFSGETGKGNNDTSDEKTDIKTGIKGNADSGCSLLIL